MKAISRQQFLVRQPSFPEEQPTDEYYLKLANHLLNKIVGSHLLDGVPDGVVQRMVLSVVGYYQDVICDGGVWHAFINECRRLYGKTIPFYPTDDSYVDYELNEADIRFMVWYSLAMNYEDWRMLSPMSEKVEGVAELIYPELERLYDDAPDPMEYRLHHELDIKDPADSKALFKLGNWLFLHCYLMTPAFALTLRGIVEEPGLDKPENFPELQKRLEQSMLEDPTGPLALYLREWLYLVVEDRMPPLPKTEEPSSETHPFHERVSKDGNGENVRFFRTYEDLNSFFIRVIGWEENEEHLPQLKEWSDFVLMTDPKKGMLVAKGIAKCIAAPGNELYDRAYAEAHAIDLLTERGKCPGDLLRQCLKEDWLPDLSFPGDREKLGKEAAGALAKENADFIARCYLQQYYRGD